MPKIQLTVKSTYLPTWGVFEGVRELVQNGRDAEIEAGAKLTVDHVVRTDGTGCLRIENEGTTLPVTALLLGHTSKLGRSDTIGKFGEGLKLGILALVRAGHAIKIRTGSEVWTPVLEESDTFRGERVLTFHIEGGRKAQDRVRVEVDGIDKAEWETMRKCFLFLVEPKDSVRCSGGTLIKDDAYKGCVYVKGIFVQKDANLSFGYDLLDADIDRDRRMIESWNLEYKTKNILVEAMNKTTRDDGNADALYALLYANATTEVHGISDQNSLWAMSSETSEALAAKFRANHGANAVPVAGLAESRDIEHLGKTGIVVAKPLAAALSKVFGTGEKLVAELKKEIVKTYSWGELTGAEQDTLLEALVLVDAIVPTSLDLLSIVDFRSASLMGQVERGGGEKTRISLSRRLLASFEETLATLIHEVAHDSAGAADGEHGHVAEIERIWTGIVRNLRAGSSKGAK